MTATESTARALLALVAPGREPDPRIVTDWDDLLDIADYHLLLPLLHARLEPLASQIPSPAAARMTLAHLESAAHAAMLERELGALRAAFSDAGIPLISFKGLPLGDRLYGDATLRPTCDVDLIVREADLDAARDVVTRRGWQPRHRFEIHEDFERRVGGIDLELELHWNSQRRGEFALPEARLWEETVEHEGARLFTLEMALLGMVLHATRHYFLPYRLLVDIAWAVEGWRDRLDWPTLTALAEEVGATPLLATLLAVVERDLDVQLPAAPGLDAVARSRWVRIALGRLEPARLLGPRRFPVLDRYLVPALVGAPIAPRLFFEDLVRTPEQIAYIYRLPRGSRWVPLYHLARPLLLTRKYLGRLLSR